MFTLLIQWKKVRREQYRDKYKTKPISSSITDYQPTKWRKVRVTYQERSWRSPPWCMWMANHAAGQQSRCPHHPFYQVLPKEQCPISSGCTPSHNGQSGTLHADKSTARACRISKQPNVVSMYFNSYFPHASAVALGERLSERTVKHINWTRRMLWIIVNGGSW